MHHPIAVGGGGDQAPLGLEDLELAVGAWAVGEALQFVLQREEILLQTGVEAEHRWAVALAFLGTPGSAMEAGEAGDVAVEIGQGSWLHSACRWCDNQPLCWRPMAAISRLACS